MEIVIEIKSNIGEVLRLVLATLALKLRVINISVNVFVGKFVGSCGKENSCIEGS